MENSGLDTSREERKVKSDMSINKRQNEQIFNFKRTNILIKTNMHSFMFTTELIFFFGANKPFKRIWNKPFNAV